MIAAQPGGDHMPGDAITKVIAGQSLPPLPLPPRFPEQCCPVLLQVDSFCDVLSSGSSTSAKRFPPALTSSVLPPGMIPSDASISSRLGPPIAYSLIHWGMAAYSAAILAFIAAIAAASAALCSASSRAASRSLERTSSSDYPQPCPSNRHRSCKPEENWHRMSGMAVCSRQSLGYKL